MISDMMRWLGHQMPNIRGLRSMPDRILKPIHNTLGFRGGVVDVLGFKMRLDPRELVDSDLWFTPHLYDWQEIDYLIARFPRKGVLIDAGSNIGFWSLRFAHGNPRCRILAIEANPSTYGILRENIDINNFQTIKPVNVGLSDSDGQLPLYCNDTGNRGGDSFAEKASDRNKRMIVSVVPLLSVLLRERINSIDVLKLDIEGFENRVLQKFFADAPLSLRPKYICTEISHSPEVIDLFKANGYRVVLTTRQNCVLER